MSSRTNPRTIAETAAAWVAARDAGLTPGKTTELNRWLAADPRHVAAFEHYAGAWSVLDRAHAGSTAGNVLRELEARAGRRRRRRLAVAGTAAVFAIVGFFAWRLTPAPGVQPSVAASHGGVLLAPETRTLEDGSVVELKRGSEIRVAFTAGLRRVVLLRGEAHFQVAKNPARPFTVEADGVQVRAVGTAFAVQRGPEQIEVLVTEGRIAVEKLTAPSAREAAAAPGGLAEDTAPSVRTLASVGAGERITVPTGTPPAPAIPVVPITAEETEARLAWRATRVEFSETPLAEAVAMMNRSAREPAAPRIVIDPNSRRLAREPVSGVFRADNAEAFVRVLELSLGVQTERRDAQLVMRRDD